MGNIVKVERVSSLSKIQKEVENHLIKEGTNYQKLTVTKKGKLEKENYIRVNGEQVLQDKKVQERSNKWLQIGLSIKNGGRWASTVESIYKEVYVRVLGYEISKGIYEGRFTGGYYKDGDNIYEGIYNIMCKSRLNNLSKYDIESFYKEISSYYGKYTVIGIGEKYQEDIVRRKIESDILYYKSKKLNIGGISKVINTYKYRGGDIKGLGAELAKSYIKTVKKNNKDIGFSEYDVKEIVIREANKIYGINGILTDEYIRGKSDEAWEKALKSGTTFYEQFLNYSIDLYTDFMTVYAYGLIKKGIDTKISGRTYNIANNLIKAISKDTDTLTSINSKRLYNKIQVSIRGLRAKGIKEDTDLVITEYKELPSKNTVILGIGDTMIFINTEAIITLPNNIVYHDTKGYFKNIPSKSMVSNHVDVEYGNWLRELSASLSAESLSENGLNTSGFNIEYEEDMYRVKRVVQLANKNEEELKKEGLDIKGIQIGGVPYIRVCTSKGLLYLNPNGIIRGGETLSVVFRRKYEDTTTSEYIDYFKDLMNMIKLDEKMLVTIGFSKQQLNTVISMIITAYDLRRAI